MKSAADSEKPLSRLVIYFAEYALAKLRLPEARILLDNDCYESAYHLAGYAVECALEACIAKMVQRYDFPDRKSVNM
jgi:hypothetical protein